MIPRVVDLSHHNTVSNFGETAKAGIWGIIHKASEGTDYVDQTYAPRRQPAVAAGLLWGAYHFNTGADVAQQVDHFLKTAAPDDKTLMVLDFEDNAKGNMSAPQAVAFLRLLEQKLGRKGAIYSGNRLKETIGALGATDRAYLLSHRLWLAQYGPKAVLPAGFSSWWLWQYTGDNVGPEPHSIAGVGGTGIDLNAYLGTQAQLAKEWSGTAAAVAATQTSPEQKPQPDGNVPTPATTSKPNPGTTPVTQEPTMANPTTTAVAAAPAAAPASDPIPTIINFIETFKNFFLPGIAALVPAPYKGAVNVAPVVVEEILQGIEDYKTKSGGDFVQSLLARAQNVLGVGKTIVAQTTSAAPVAATKSEGMPNS